MVTILPLFFAGAFLEAAEAKQRQSRGKAEAKQQLRDYSVAVTQFGVINSRKLGPIWTQKKRKRVEPVHTQRYHGLGDDARTGQPRQTDGQTHTQTDRHTDRHTDGNGGLGGGKNS